jgi:hypothetical protein
MTALSTVRIVCATTKRTREDFDAQTLLGQSLQLLPVGAQPEISIRLDNGGAGAIGLSEVYNAFLQPRYAGEIVTFVHDDVFINDWWLVVRLREAMQQFDVVGVAGNAEPDLSEPSWATAWNKEKYPDGRQPRERLSGAVAHFDQDRSSLGVHSFGMAPRACVLLDGLFIAVNVDRALAGGVAFDEQFQFHFYDLDFCRRAHQRGLRIGTWPIAVTHGSQGGYESAQWVEAMQKYSDKWPVEEPRSEPEQRPHAGILGALLGGRRRS